MNINPLKQRALTENSSGIGAIPLVMDAIDRLPQTGAKDTYLRQQLQDKLIEHKQYIHQHGEDMPEIRNWKWMEPKKAKNP